MRASGGRGGTVRRRRWWRRDIPIQYPILLLLAVILGGCVAVLYTDGQQEAEGQKQAVAALERIDVPGSTWRSKTTRPLCNDYQSPSAVRSETSSIPASDLADIMQLTLVEDGWSYKRTLADEDLFSRDEVSLFVSTSPHGDGAMVELSANADAYSCR